MQKHGGGDAGSEKNEPKREKIKRIVGHYKRRNGKRRRERGKGRRRRKENEVYIPLAKKKRKCYSIKLLEEREKEGKRTKRTRNKDYTWYKRREDWVVILKGRGIEGGRRERR